MIGDSVSPFGRALSAAFAEAAESTGLELVVKSPPSVENVAQSCRLVAALAGDPEMRGLIIACGVGGTELAQAAEPLRARGGVVIAYLGRMPTGVARSTVLVDEGTVIATAVEQCVKRLTDGDELSMLRSNVRQGEANDRERLAIAGIRERRPGVSIHANIFMNAEGRTALDQAKLLLTTYPKTKLVYSPYSTATIAMISALRETGRAGMVRHVGIGVGVPPECAAAIAAGELDVWIALDPRDVALKAADAAAGALAGRTLPEVVYSKVQVLTKENLPPTTAGR